MEPLMKSNQDIEAPEISVKTIPTVIIRPSIRHAGDVSNKVANLERREAVINTKRAWRDVAACAGVFLVIILLITVDAHFIGFSQVLEDFF